ncbi:hypothetical protein LTR54_017535 [Friedmanniomyces endolithicus]|nr:hypothetical protein LTR54_017535 [Friedmanniomyces endolithicus]
MQLDVTSPFEKLQEKMKEAVGKYGRIDVYVANAGYVQYAPIEEADHEKDLIKQMATNTFGATNILRAVMPYWREQKSGFLLVNSSYMSWWSTRPGVGSYAASKAALDPTFAAETAALGFIKVLTVHPGHFSTDVTNPRRYEFPKKSLNYQQLSDFYADYVPNQMHGKQPGDVGMGAKVMIDLVKCEGGATGKELPPSIPLGTDAFELVKETEKYLKMLHEWEKVIRSTDVVEGSSAWATG